MKVLIATGNPSKFREMTAVLGEWWSEPTRVEPVASVTSEPARVEPDHAERAQDGGIESIKWIGLDGLPVTVAEPVETGTTFLENATLKAVYYSRVAGMWALADDSGLEVDALHGRPGVVSAYFDERAADQPRAVRDAANNAKLIAALADVPPQRRTARYRCVLVLADGDRVLATADGVLEGLIISEPRGSGGFGYDPYFYLPERGRTVAELSADDKNSISHRGQAMRKMGERLRAIRTGI